MGTKVAGDFLSEYDGFLFNNNWTYDQDELNQVMSLITNALDTAEGLLSPLIGMLAGPAIALEAAVCGPFAPICITETISDIESDLLSTIRGKLASGTYGRCGGMAFAAADYYYKNWVVPQGTPPDSTRTPPPVGPDYAQPDDSTPQSQALRSYIWNRLMDSITNNLSTWLQWIGVQHLSDNGPQWLCTQTAQQFEIIKAAILAHTSSRYGMPVPIGLVGTTWNPLNDHQVLVYGYTDNNDQTGSLFLYDNNQPGKEAVIEFDLRGPILATTRDDTLIAGTQDRGPLRGFFASAYTPKTPPEAVVLERGMTAAKGCGGFGTPLEVSFTAKNVGYCPSTPLKLQVATSAGGLSPETPLTSIPPGQSSTVHEKFTLGPVGNLTFTAGAFLADIGTVLNTGQQVLKVKTLPPASAAEHIHTTVKVLPAVQVSVAGVAAGEVVNAAGQRQKFTVDTDPLGDGPYLYSWTVTPAVPVSGANTAVVDVTLPAAVGTEVTVSVVVTTSSGCTTTGSLAFKTVVPPSHPNLLVFYPTQDQDVPITSVTLGGACTGLVRVAPTSVDAVEVALSWFPAGFAISPASVSVYDYSYFPVQTEGSVAQFTSTSGQLAAGCNGVTITAVLDLVAPADVGVLSEISVAPTSIEGGGIATGYARLVNPVSTPTTVTLRATLSGAHDPHQADQVAVTPSVIIAPGEAEATFQVSVSSVSEGGLAVIDGFAWNLRSAELTVTERPGGGTITRP